MYNHSRTLLMNVTGGNGSFYGEEPGEELIPAAYRPVTLPGYLTAIRSQLFGIVPDRAFLNMRTFQLLQAIESTDLRFRNIDFDDRITYKLEQVTELSLAATYAPVVQQTENTANTLAVHGLPASPDLAGRSYFKYLVTVTGADVVIVNRVTDISGHTTLAFNVELTAGLTNPIPLTGSGYSVRLSGLTVGDAWTVSGYLKPTKSLAEIVQSLTSVRESYMLQLFGLSDTEPYSTFRNCWNNHPDLAYKISGIVLALIRRTEELRTNGQ